MPLARTQDSFEPTQDHYRPERMRDPGLDPFVPENYPDISAIVQAAEMAGGAPNGASVAEAIISQFGSEIAVAEGKVADLVDLMGRQYNEDRERRDYSLWFDRAERRLKGSEGLDIVYDTAGNITGGEDAGNRRCGRTLGLVPEAAKAAVALIDEYCFDGARLPAQFWATGKNDENDDKERLLELAVADQHEHGGYKPAVRAILWDFVNQDYCLGRLPWVVETRLMPGDDENMTMSEQIVHEGVKLLHWPPQNAWFSDYDKPTAGQQRTMIWFSTKTLGELELEEAFLAQPERLKMGLTGEVVMARLILEKGRFRGLDRLRRRYLEQSGTEQLAVPAQGFTWIESRPGQTQGTMKAKKAITPTFGLLELEGHLPLASLVYNGFITPAFLDYHGIDIGDYRQMTKREVAMRLERVFWSLSLTTERHLLEMQPTKYRGATGQPMNTAVFASYYPGDGIIGQGITRATWDAAEMADFYLNEIVLNVARRSRPGRVINTRRAFGPDGKELQYDDLLKFLQTLDGVIQAEGSNVDAQKMVELVAPEDIVQRTFEQLLFQKQRVEAISSMTEQVKGSAVGEADITATESQNATTGAMRLGRHSGKIFGQRIIEEIDRGILVCFSAFMEATGDMQNPGSWEDYILKVAGAAGLNSWYLLPSLKNLPRQFLVVHSGNPLGRKDLVAAFWGKIIVEQGPLGRLDVGYALERQLSLMDERNPERAVIGAAKPREPHVEIRAFANDHYLAPVEGENLLDHYITHVLQLAAIDPVYLLDMGGPEAIVQNVAMVAGPVRAQQMMKDIAEWSQLNGSVAPAGMDNYKYESDILGPTLLHHAIETQNRLSELIGQMQMAALKAQENGQGGEKKGKGEDENENGGQKNGQLGPTMTDQGDLQGGVQNMGPQDSMPGDTGA